jgi:hypothetical protein
VTAQLPEKHRGDKSGFDEDSMNEVLECLERRVTCIARDEVARSAHLSSGDRREFRSKSFRWARWCDSTVGAPLDLHLARLSTIGALAAAYLTLTKADEASLETVEASTEADWLQNGCLGSSNATDETRSAGSSDTPIQASSEVLETGLQWPNLSAGGDLRLRLPMDGPVPPRRSRTWAGTFIDPAAHVQCPCRNSTWRRHFPRGHCGYVVHECSYHWVYERAEPEFPDARLPRASYVL